MSTREQASSRVVHGDAETVDSRDCAQLVPLCVALAFFLRMRTMGEMYYTVYICVYNVQPSERERKKSERMVTYPGGHRRERIVLALVRRQMLSA